MASKGIGDNLVFNGKLLGMMFVAVIIVITVVVTMTLTPKMEDHPLPESPVGYVIG